MQEAGEMPHVRADDLDGARMQLLVEEMAEVRTRARRYIQEPAEDAWHDLVEALTRTYGDTDAYDILRAVEIHSRTRGRR